MNNKLRYPLMILFSMFELFSIFGIFSQIHTYVSLAISMSCGIIIINTFCAVFSWGVYFSNKDLILAISKDIPESNQYMAFLSKFTWYCLVCTLLLFEYYILGFIGISIIISSAYLKRLIKNEVTTN